VDTSHKQTTENLLRKQFPTSLIYTVDLRDADEIKQRPRSSSNKQKFLRRPPRQPRTKNITQVQKGEENIEIEKAEGLIAQEPQIPQSHKLIKKELPKACLQENFLNAPKEIVKTLTSHRKKAYTDMESKLD